MVLFYSPYSDYPDGEDCFTKMYYCAKIGFKFAIFSGSLYCVMRKRHTQLKPALNTLAFFVFPLTLGGATFAGVACAATNLRKKDDAFNYTMGAVAGSIVSASQFPPGFTQVKVLYTLLNVGMASYSKILDQNNMSWYDHSQNYTRGQKFIDNTIYIRPFEERED